ncbi:hypothetical protein C5Y96_07075 [Blastopirellula marina]|uniref:Uncharacterized protein n=1 Tax=Blastopirellula marina TaxID=124 RepID=A0A2S8FXK9_9BACT|nr:MULTISPECIES: hypothetical protein [Pirellulaceae]PQO36917.1 hypothetical protein C5Y96_07075 [Blastopirellula marina]RCS53632.1 hypothetical protein DTL36_07085 [Bremerella cremea]
MSQYSFTLAFAFVGLMVHVVAADEVKIEPGKENVVASRIEGDWQVHAPLTERLTGGQGLLLKRLSFKSDPAVATKIPGKYAEYFQQQNMKVYLAGRVDLDGKKCPFVVTNIHGNPHVIFWLERDGDPFGNGESFNVMLTVAEDRQNDLLFVGGDFNNQPFSAFERVKAESPR